MDQNASEGEQVSTGAVTVTIRRVEGAIGEQLPRCPDWPELNWAWSAAS